MAKRRNVNSAENYMKAKLLIAAVLVAFLAAPDFENPTDAGTNGVYDVQVTVTDSGGLTDTQDIDDVNGAHIHVGPAGENGPVLVNLQQGGDYNTSPSTGSADGTIAFTQSDFTRLLADPAGFYVNFHTAPAPGGLVRAQLTQAPMTFFADLSGANETDPVTPNAAGALTAIFTGVHTCSFTVTMPSSAASSMALLRTSLLRRASSARSLRRPAETTMRAATRSTG